MTSFWNFQAALAQANAVAYLTGHRCRVYYDVLNRWWNVIEEATPIVRRVSGSDDS